MLEVVVRPKIPENLGEIELVCAGLGGALFFRNFNLGFELPTFSLLSHEALKKNYGTRE